MKNTIISYTQTPLTPNNLKRRAISLFSIGLLGTFMSLWQVEVPQKVIINMFDDKIEIFNNNYTVLNELDYHFKVK